MNMKPRVITIVLALAAALLTIVSTRQHVVPSRFFAEVTGAESPEVLLERIRKEER